MAQYWLKIKELRDTIDLTAYEKEITEGVHYVLGKKVKVEVFFNYYEVYTEPTAGQARLIGSRISYLCEDLRNLRKTYKPHSLTARISRQIFVRRKIKNEKK